MKKRRRAARKDRPIHHEVDQMALARRILRMLSAGKLELNSQMDWSAARFDLERLVTLAVEKGSESEFAGVGEWVDFSFTRNSRQRLLGLLRQEKYRTKHVTKSIDLEGVAHTGLSAYAAHHQLTFSAAVTKLLEQVSASSSGERERPH